MASTMTDADIRECLRFLYRDVDRERLQGWRDELLTLPDGGLVLTQGHGTPVVVAAEDALVLIGVALDLQAGDTVAPAEMLGLAPGEA